MKILFKSALTLTFLTIVAVVVSLLLSAMKELYIESWFILDPSVVIGLSSGLLLTTILALANVHQLQRAHAKERSALLKRFQVESAAFVTFSQTLSQNAEEFEIPGQQHAELERALTRLDELSVQLTRSERISPLKSRTIQTLRFIVSPIAKAELAFEQAFTPFSECSSLAYHAHGILPYLGEESQRQATQAEFGHNLRRLSEFLQTDSVLSCALRSYQARINRLLGNPQETITGQSNAE